MLGLVPIMGLLAVLQIERQQTYGRVMAMACTPPAGLCFWQLIQARDGTQRQEHAAAILEQFQALGMAVEGSGQTLSAMIDAVLRVQPAIEMATLLLIFVVAYRLSEGLALRLRLSLPAPLPLSLWRPWEELIWVLIAALGLSLLSDGLLADLGLNLIVLMGIIYAVQGLAVLRFFRSAPTGAAFGRVIVLRRAFLCRGLGVSALGGLGAFGYVVRLAASAPSPHRGRSVRPKQHRRFLRSGGQVVKVNSIKGH